MSNELNAINDLLKGVELRGERIIVGVSHALGKNVRAYYIGTRFITLALFVPDREPNSRWQWVIADTQSCWYDALALKETITKIFESILNI